MYAYILAILPTMKDNHAGRAYRTMIKDIHKVKS